MKEKQDRSFGVGRIVIGGVLLLIIIAASALPVLYESQSLYYKFGREKLLLLLGKGAGFAALVLMLAQIVFISKFRILVKGVGIRSLFSYHRIAGLGAGVLVLIHPLCILWADNFAFFPFERRYWPELLGVFTLICLLAVIGTAIFRGRLPMGHKAWQRLHRIFAPGCLALAFVHAGFVSGTFSHRVPTVSLALAGGIALVMLVRIYIKPRAG